MVLYGYRQMVVNFTKGEMVQMEVSLVRKEIKQLLKGYKKMNKKTKSQLEGFGFEITETGKHYKITHPSNREMVVTLGKTVSDFRAGRNTARYLCYLV